MDIPFCLSRSMLSASAERLRDVWTAIWEKIRVVETQREYSGPPVSY